MLISLAAAVALTASAQDPAAPLDTQPLETVPVDASAGVQAGGVTRSRPIDSFFSFDPYARGRGLVVSPADVVLACAGAGPLRDAALSCPLDHQVALRGLPGLLQACAAIGRGGTVPTTATPVPHAATIKAAADARAASSARLMQDCAFHLEASREGAELQVAVPATSGVVEVRVGWRPQAVRPMPGDPPPAVIWLPAVYQPAVPHRPEDVARTVDLGAIRPERGWWRFDLAVEVLDEAGAATRVVMPVDIAETGVAGPVELGPSLEVAVGTGSGNLSLADLPIPPVPPGDAGSSQGRPGTDRTPPAGAGTDPLAIDQVLDACTHAPEGLTAASCRRLQTGDGRLAWPPEGSGPIVGAAARDDLVGLLRRLGERILQQQARSPVAERAWMTEDAAMVVAALGGMLETMVHGSDPVSAMASWARQRPPTLPTGERFGFFVDDQHRAAPVSSTLYLASLVAASTPEPVEGPPQTGVSILTLASNLAWSDNLPGGIRAPWSGTLHPKMGAADLGWLSAVAEVLDDTRASLAPSWEALRRGGPEVVPALGALYGQATTAILSAAALVPDQAGDAREVRAARRALLDRLLGRLPDIYARVARADLPGTADAALALVDDPDLREALPPITRADFGHIGALATLAAPHTGARSVRAHTTGLVGVVGVGTGLAVTPDGAGVLLAPTAAVAWQRQVLSGRTIWGWRLPVVDLGAPWTWTPGAEAPMAVDWRAVFSPGVHLTWAPSPRSMSLQAGARISPFTTSDGASGGSVVRFELGAARAVPLSR